MNQEEEGNKKTAESVIVKETAGSKSSPKRTPNGKNTSSPQKDVVKANKNGSQVKRQVKEASRDLLVNRSELKKRPAKKKPIVKEDKKEDEEETPEQLQKRFEKELKWCLETLDTILVSDSSSASSSSGGSGGSAAATRLREGQKVRNSLRSSKTSVIRKRLLMSNFFGDYRSKMAKEELKFQTKSSISNCLKQEGKTKKSGVFLKKRLNKTATNPQDASSVSTSTSSSNHFTFNFDSIAQDIDMDHNGPGTSTH
jgi:hypothetical protein